MKKKWLVSGIILIFIGVLVLGGVVKGTYTKYKKGLTGRLENKADAWFIAKSRYLSKGDKLTPSATPTQPDDLVFVGIMDESAFKSGPPWDIKNMVYA